jgi:glycerol-3-phosphate acyltransferase PlsY
MLAVLLGYLAGSVPFAFLLARRAGIDVRAAGSGNVGAANVLRTTGTGRAVAVMALDVAKGAAAVALAYLASGGAALAALTGAAAVVGHIYPVWLRFHGGKGVAVAAGVFAVLTPLATAVAALLFLITVWSTRYVSLGSVAATVALPPTAWLAGAPAAVVGTAWGTAALIVFRHRSNLRRLRAGTERRIGNRHERLHA